MEFVYIVFLSLVKSNILVTAFKLRVFFYKVLKISKKVTFFSNKIGFSHLYIVIKEGYLIIALVILYNRKKASNISINKFK